MFEVRATNLSHGRCFSKLLWRINRTDDLESNFEETDSIKQYKSAENREPNSVTLIWDV